MKTYFKVVRKEVDAQQYFPEEPIPEVIQVPGAKFGVVIQSEYRGKIVGIGDFVVKSGRGTTVKTAERFLGEYTEDPDSVPKVRDYPADDWVPEKVPKTIGFKPHEWDGHK